MESRKGKEEFEGLSELLQIELEVQCEEIVSQERVDNDHVTQVESMEVIAADVVEVNRENADAVERNHSEENAAPTTRKKTDKKTVKKVKKKRHNF